MAFAAFGSTAGPVEQAPRRRSWVALVLLLPGLSLPRPVLSHAPRLARSDLVPGACRVRRCRPVPAGVEIENYATVIEAYWPHFLRAFGYAIVATIAALLIGYPLAYFIGVKCRSKPLLQAMLLTLVIAPFFISFLLRTSPGSS